MVKKIAVTDSLAVKYRPKVMDDLIGNAGAKAIFSGMIKRGKIHSTILIHGGTGMGKCLIGSTLVRTTDGMIPIRQLVQPVDNFSEYTGPLVYDGFGKAVKPEAGYRKIAEKTIRLTTKFGIFEGTPEHPMLALKEDGDLGFFRLAQLGAGDMLAVAKSQSPIMCKADTAEQEKQETFGKNLIQNVACEETAKIIRDGIQLECPTLAYYFVRGLTTGVSQMDEKFLFEFDTYSLAKEVSILLMNWNIRSRITGSVLWIEDTEAFQSLFSLEKLVKSKFRTTYVAPIHFVEGDDFNSSQTAMIRELQNFTEIEEVEYLFEPKFVYDLSMGQSKSFQTECHISHNTTMARMLARYVNCETGDACGKCNSCLMGDAHPDITEVNMASERGIDDARNLIQKAKFAPRTNKRFIIMDELHALTPQAREAFLKPLEEPPANTVWVLCTTEPEKLTGTILGRCQQISVTPPTKVEMLDLLKRVSREEGIKVTAERLPTLKYISEAAMGHSRNALQLLETYINIVSGNRKISAEELEKLLVVSTGGDLDEAAAHLTAAILKGDGKEAIKLLYKAGQNKEIMGLLMKMRWLLDYKLNSWAGTMKFTPHIAKLFDKAYGKRELQTTHIIKILSTLVDCEIRIKTVSGLDERLYLSSRILDDMVSITSK